MSYSLYFHIPFCRHRCAYCDFNTYAGQDALIPAYVEALCREIQLVGESARITGTKTGAGVFPVSARPQVHTLFFGGGTPSLLDPSQFEAVLKVTRDHFDLLEDAEISLEANPRTVSLGGLQDLRSLGFNRLSLGVQSAHPEELHLLERIHDYHDVLAAVVWARRAGFENLNLDLIYGLPEQSLDRWQATINLVLGLHPQHFSLYALTLEQSTPFGRWSARGLMSVPDPDLAADMYEWAGDALEAAGYEQYEISNWARPGRQCRHNLQYWRNQPYLGFGAGSHGFAGHTRYANVTRIKTYLKRLLDTDRRAPFPVSPAAAEYHSLTLREQMQETMLTGLRLTVEGVSATGFGKRFGRDLREVFGAEIDVLVGYGLLEWAGDSLRLTRRGRLMGNQVFIRFVG